VGQAKHELSGKEGSELLVSSEPTQSDAVNQMEAARRLPLSSILGIPALPLLEIKSSEISLLNTNTICLFIISLRIQILWEIVIPAS
jgi:hypothetical protein